MIGNVKLKQSYISLLVIVSLSYFFSAQLGLLLASINKIASPVWPASGIAIGTLLVFGTSIWPAIFLGAFTANLILTQTPLLPVFGIAVGNTIEALLTVYLIQKMKLPAQSFEFKMHSSRLLIAILVATAVGASIGVLSLISTNLLPIELSSKVWFTWWIGDSVGALVVTPLFLNFKKEYLKHKTWDWKNIFQALTIIGIAAATIVSIFSYIKFTPLIFILFPILLLSHKKLNPFGISFLVLTICAVCVWRSIIGDGLFVGQSLNDNLILLQIFLLSFSIAASFISSSSQVMLMRRPTMVLLCGWTISALVFYSYQRNANLKDVERFTGLIEDQKKNIKANFEYYYEALEGGASLYAATQNVSSKQWRAFVNRSQITERRPGINGIGVIWPVNKNNVQTFLRKIQDVGFSNFVIKKVPNAIPPIENSASEYIITFIEPLEKNKQALGLDIGSESNRRISADLARDTGLPTITKKITLVQASKKGPGFLLYVPIYKSGNPPLTIEERRRQFLGWIYAPFVTASFLKGALISQSKEFSFFVFEGTTPTSDSLLYRSDSKTTELPNFEKQTKMSLGQQWFTIGWVRTPDFQSTHDTTSAIIALCGVLVTLLFAGLIVNLETTNQRAQSLADEQTQRLRLNEVSLKEALEKAKRATQIKSEFLANMSHEIRTPMNAIIGMADLLDDSPLNEDQKKYVGIFKRAGESLLHVINDILDFSKIESGQLKIENSEFNLRTLINEIIEVSNINAVAKGINLFCHFDPEVSDHFLGDALRIRQVMMNLVGNAIKFTAAGRVTICVGKNTQTNRRGNILVSVKDTGIGIPLDKQTSLFQAFTQADSSVTKKYGGTGLGLAISKSLIEKMGGEIWITSEVGSGSEFFFTLECSQLSSQVIQTSSSQFKPSETKNRDTVLIPQSAIRLLLVDDSEDNRTLIKEYLKKTNYTIIEAENGKLAVSKFKEGRFDIVFMDMQMPVKDGYTATAEIRKWESENNLKATLIVALTAYALKEEQEKCLKAGCDLHMAKPIKKKVLLDMLNQYDWSLKAA